MNEQAALLSARLAATTTIILMLIGLPLAYALSFAEIFRGSRAGRGAKVVAQSVVALPLVLPPTVLGFYLLIAFGGRSALGRWFERATGHTFAFSFSGLLVASILYSLPFAMQPLMAAFASVDHRLMEASELLGASRWRTLRRVVLPLSRAGVISAAVLSFAHTVGEFGVVLMVGGNIPGVTRTLSIDIYDRVQEFDLAGAQTTSLWLLLFSFVALLVTYSTGRQAQAR